MDLFLLVLMILYTSISAITENVYSNKGSFYTFVCPHRKTSTHNVIWQFKNKSGTIFGVSDGTFLSAGYPGKNRTEIIGDNSNGEYNMKLSGLQESDEGTYRCLVFTNSTEYYLELLAAPTELILYDVVNNEIRQNEGQSLSISCTATGGKPPPDMTLNVGSQVFTGRQSVVYTIPELQRSHDKQSVKCQANSQALVSPLEETATLYLYLKPAVPTFNQDPPRTTATKPLIVSCSSTGSRPVGVIYWKVKSSTITTGIVQQNTSNPLTDTYIVVSTLTYAVDRSYNEQPITCGVTHQTLSQGLETTTTMDVQFASDLTVSNKTYTQTDTTRTIQCTADGNPSQYTYYKWQHISTYGVLIRELDGGDDGLLRLPTVNESNRYQDNGEYICTVGNGIEDSEGKIKQTGSGYITVNAQPVFTSDNDDTTIQYGEIGKTTGIHVYVYSIPKYSQFTWYKGNTQLPQNNKYGITETRASVRSIFYGVAVQLDGFLLTLAINNLVEGDFTIYKLRLSGGYGQPVEHSVILEFASAPHTPKNFSITDSSVSSISLQWDAGFNGGHDQTFHVEYRVSGTTTWFTKTVPTNEQTGRQIYVLPGLNDGTSYEVRMYSENKFNESLPTEIDSILTVTDQESQSSTGPIIGGVVGGLVACIVVIFVVIYLRTRGVKQKPNSYKKYIRKTKESSS